MTEIAIVICFLLVFVALLMRNLEMAEKQRQRHRADAGKDQIQGFGMKEEAPKCPHDDWLIVGSESTAPPHGTCARCGEAVRLDILLNAWKLRIERELLERK